eukprot:m.207957 g.207957  ORF g.207957 m.207957 type:complete len:899 (+) comp17127_c0_seq1:88-2784(+)
MAQDANRPRTASAISVTSIHATTRPDFLLVAEFCEIVGPKPLFTMPPDVGMEYRDTLSLDGIALWLLSADTQSCIETEGRYSMPQDTQAIMSEPADHVHALVQYSQLFDITARGFTRTFCVAYVTDHCEKLITHYNDLVHELTIISRLLHFGNQVDVLLQLEKQLLRLRLTTDDFLREQAEAEPDHPDFFSTLQQRRDTQIEDFEGLKEHVDRLMAQDAHMDDLMQQYEARLRDPTGLTRRRTGTLGRDRPGRGVSRDRSASFSERVRTTSLAQPTNLPEPIDFIKLRDYKAPLRPLNELSAAFFSEIVLNLQRLHSHYQRPQGVLLMEQEESRLLAHPAFLLTIGRCVVQSFYMPPIAKQPDRSNSIVFSPFRSAPASARIDKSSTRPVEFSFDETGDSWSIDQSTTSVDEGAPYTGVWFDPSYLHTQSPEEATYQRDSQSYSGWTDDDASMYSAMEDVPNDAFVSPSDPGRLTPKFFTPPDSRLSQGPVTSSPRIPTTSTKAQRQLTQFDAMDLTTPKAETAMLSHELTPMPNHIPSDTTPEGTAANSPNTSRLEGESIKGDESFSTLTSAKALAKEDPLEAMPSSLPRHISNRPKLSRSKASSNSLAESWNDSIASQQFQPFKQCKFPFQSAADHVAHSSDRKPGVGMLRFRANVPFAKHIVFALLSGWPVVVTGREGAVKAMVKTLWFFVPGNSPWNKVTTWKADGNLSFQDLAVYKLVGLPSQAVRGKLSKAVFRNVCVYDVEHQVYWGPAYKGIYVRRMFTRAMDFTSEASLFAHLHDLLLQLGWKAFQYFHEVCMADGLRSTAAEARSPLQDMRKIREILAAWSVSDGDVDIAMYLAETVEAQLVMEHYRQTGVNSDLESAESPALPIKLRHQAKNMFCVNERIIPSSVFG